MGASGSAGAAGATTATTTATSPGGAYNPNAQVKPATAATGNSQYGGVMGSLSNFFGGMGSGMSGQQVQGSSGSARAMGANFGQALGSGFGGVGYNQPAVYSQPQSQVVVQQPRAAAVTPMPQSGGQVASVATSVGGQKAGGDGTAPMVSGVAVPTIQTQQGSYFSPAATAVPDYVGMMMSMGGPAMGGGGGGSNRSGQNAMIGSAIGAVGGAAIGAAFGGAGAGIGMSLGSAVGGAVGTSV